MDTTTPVPFADAVQIRADLRQRGHHCRSCEHYERKHTGGPRGAGTCRRKQLPMHANTCACERWEPR